MFTGLHLLINKYYFPILFNKKSRTFKDQKQFQVLSRPSDKGFQDAQETGLSDVTVLVEQIECGLAWSVLSLSTLLLSESTTNFDDCDVYHSQ